VFGGVIEILLVDGVSAAQNIKPSIPAVVLHLIILPLKSA
jgi:hypothetical protein